MEKRSDSGLLTMMRLDGVPSPDDADECSAFVEMKYIKNPKLPNNLLVFLYSFWYKATFNYFIPPDINVTSSFISPRVRRIRANH